MCFKNLCERLHVLFQRNEPIVFNGRKHGHLVTKRVVKVGLEILFVETNIPEIQITNRSKNFLASQYISVSNLWNGKICILNIQRLEGQDSGQLVKEDQGRFWGGDSIWTPAGAGRSLFVPQCKQLYSEITPYGRFTSASRLPGFYRMVKLSQCLLGNDSVAMKVL